MPISAPATAPTTASQVAAPPPDCSHGITPAQTEGPYYKANTPTLAASLLSELKGDLRGQRPATNPLDELTERESQILERVAAGLSNKEIAQQLFLSEKTVKHYMTNILQKLQVRNRVEAALLAQSEGLEGKTGR
jgi:DNA-binding NarL/FixJ family response regulator